MNPNQMNRKEPKKLIEVAMPIKEVSVESVRDKSIRHGHISTLHLWWARRPLPVCRAVVFASLVPDPLDENCPPSFRDAVETLLGPDPQSPDLYKPYTDIPFTPVEDSMEDNLRNRLLMFIGKFSDQFFRNEKEGKTTPANAQLSDAGLIKWDNKNNKAVIDKARKLIWVAHDPQNNTLELFDSYSRAVEEAQDRLFQTPDRHIPSPDVAAKEAALQQALLDFLHRMPAVFDPFAGGGAIPLEAARLGCRTFANDINPVAHIIERCSLEFPQKYGKPIVYSRPRFIERYGEELLASAAGQDKLMFSQCHHPVTIHNRLAFDVEFYAKKMLKIAEEQIGHLYPPDEKGNKPVAYYWARVAQCANPACQAQVPLLRDFYLVYKDKKQIYLNPIINRNHIDFEIKRGKHDLEGWMNRANLKCPCCGNMTDVKVLKKNFVDKKTSERMIAVIYENENGKEYRLPTEKDFLSVRDISNPYPRPFESMDNGNARDLKLPKWGFKLWADMFSHRQLVALQTLVSAFHEIKTQLQPQQDDYAKAIVTYLGILIDRMSVINTSFGRWDNTRENIQSPFSRQAIPMIFDFPESNPFCTSSGSAYNHIEWILRYIESESGLPFFTECSHSSSGEISQFPPRSIDATVTDPPYYDAVAYADLSDFFYVWLKRTISGLYPSNFIYPQTPKTDECTALKHHHNGNLEDAKSHFENKLLQIFTAIEKQTSGVVAVMFAHQSTEAWTTLCNSILNANMNITGSWAIDTELGNRMVAMEKAALASSVTVSCRPSQRSGFGEYKEVKKAVEQTVKKEVKILYNLGFRGADLLTSCFGQAASEFGKYEKVEKADGTAVTIDELLKLARESVFNTIISDIDTDIVSRFYIGWLNLFGFTPADHDDVRSITQIGLNVDSNELLSNHILIRSGNHETLAPYKHRSNSNPKLAENPNPFTIDLCHKAMELYAGGNREKLLIFLEARPEVRETIFWRVMHALAEVLPHGTDDHKQCSGLLADKESLLRDAKAFREKKAGERTLF